jgi:hypothetical protein
LVLRKVSIELYRRSGIVALQACEVLKYGSLKRVFEIDGFLDSTRFSIGKPQTLAYNTRHGECGVVGGMLVCTYLF